MRLQLLSLLMKLFRLTAYKSIAVIRQCRNTTMQYLSKSSTQNSVATLNRWRRPIMFVLVVCALILYIWPSWLIPTRYRVQPQGPLDTCIESKISRLRATFGKFDVLLGPEHKTTLENTYYPYVGNGYIGAAIESTSKIYLKYGRILSVPVHFYPLYEITAEGLQSKDVSVTDIRAGTVNKVQCFQMDKMCMTASSQMYAHRTRPSLLVQDIHLDNPTKHPVTMSLEQIAVSSWHDATSEKKKVVSGRGDEVEYILSVGTVPVPESIQGLVFIVAVASVQLPDTITVTPNEPIRWQGLTAVKFTQQPQSGSGIDGDKKDIAEQAEKELLAALKINKRMLREEHITVWTQLWKSGFGISRSKAEGALNGDQINATIYYILSHVPSPIHEIGVSDKRKQDLQGQLFYQDRCYEGHYTLQNSQMWEKIQTLQKLNSIVTSWIVTLEKRGCAPMLKAGADGVLQAVILSFGGFKFSNHHLEFWMQAKDLHRDYFFRRINYGNNTHVNISVIVGKDNKPVLFTALDRNDKPYYACDAGCIDPSIKLSREQSQFPVKRTDPESPILYITSDKEHMDILKHTIHLKEIAIAPPHGHEVLALHRHGHHYGGLPVMFWVSIGILITIFHLFLFKLIFNEYCQSSPVPYQRTRYNV